MRLGVDTIDLYLLHWRGPIPPAETLEAFAALAGAGKIRNWGVSNFDVTDLEELIELPGGDEMSTDQVLYNLQNHGIEFDLLPWCDRRSVPIMAYSPIEQGRPLTKPALRSVAARHRPTPAQAALAWVLRRNDVCAIPRASRLARVRENRAALNTHLSAADLAELDRAFPPPDRKLPLAV